MFLTLPRVRSAPPLSAGSLSGLEPVAPAWLPPSLARDPSLGSAAVPSLGDPLAAPPPPEPSSSAVDDLILPLSGLPPVPAHLVQAIKANKFVDLADLLPENLRELQFDQAKDSKAKEESKKKKAAIASTLDWSVAFTTFMAVSAHCQPERAFALAAYFSIVLNLARDIGGQAWSRYDRLFRQAASVSSSLPWHRREPDIWLMAIPDPGGSLLPSARPPSQSSLPPAVRAPPSSDQTDICRRWNQGRCNFPKCKYRHVCFVCESQHLTRSCPLLTPAARLSDRRGEPQPPA